MIFSKMSLRTELDLRLPGVRGSMRFRKAFEQHGPTLYMIMDSLEARYPLLKQGAMRWTTRALLANVLENAAGHKKRSKVSKRKPEAVNNNEDSVSLEETTPKRRRRFEVSLEDDEGRSNNSDSLKEF